MPRNLNADAEAPHQLSPEERRTKIQEAADSIRELQGQVEALGKQRSALNKKITAVFRDVKSVLGINRKHLTSILDLLTLEEEELNGALSQLRECYLALSEGEQLDFITALEEQGKHTEAGHA